MLNFKSISRGLCLGALAGAILAAPAARAADKQAAFGFTDAEIFPIDPQISLLHAADLDGDGLTDLIVVNNARSKINLLYNRPAKQIRPCRCRERKERSMICRPTPVSTLSPSRRKRGFPRWWWRT